MTYRALYLILLMTLSLAAPVALNSQELVPSAHAQKLVIIPASADTYVAQGQYSEFDGPDGNYGYSPTMRIYECGAFCEGSRRAYVRFDDLSTIPADQILSAKLRLILANYTGNGYLSTGRTNGDPMPIRVHEVTDAWDEYSLTWDTQPSFDSTILDQEGILTVSTPTAVDFNLPVSIVQKWVTNSTLNHGLVFKTDEQFYQPFGSNANFYTRDYMRCGIFAEGFASCLQYIPGTKGIYAPQLIVELKLPQTLAAENPYGPGKPFVVEVTRPVDTETFAFGAPVVVSWSVTSPHGISKINVIVDGHDLYTIENSNQKSTAVNGLDSGMHEIIVRVTDLKGQSMISEPVTIYVLSP